MALVRPERKMEFLLTVQYSDHIKDRMTDRPVTLIFRKGRLTCRIIFPHIHTHRPILIFYCSFHIDLRPVRLPKMRWKHPRIGPQIIYAIYIKTKFIRLL